MKRLIKHSIKMALVFFSLLLLSCATTGQLQRYTPGSIIDTGSYSVTGPPGDGWFVKIHGGVIELYRPATPSGSDLILVLAVRSDMMEKEDRYPSEEEKAFESIKYHEESEKQDAKKGDCVLNDVKKGTTMIGEKKLHFISTKTSGCREGPARRASLFHVFFPADFNERHTYYWFHLFQFRDKESPLESADLTLIKPVIDSLKIKPQIEVVAKDAEEYFQLGLTHAQKGDFEQARLYYSKAIEMDPKNPSPYNARGGIYMTRGQYDRAISDFTKALEIRPGLREAYSNRGVAYARKGEHDQAIADYTKAIEINPNIAWLYSNRGISFCKKGQHDQAISDCNKALEINPRFAIAYDQRGIAYSHKGQHNQAISDYTKAIEINPKHAPAYCNRGSSYADKGEYDRAISDYTKAIEIEPRSAHFYYRRAYVYYLQKEYDKSWEDVKMAQALGYKIAPEFLDDLRKVSGREN